jgi:hypothetical protein
MARGPQGGIILLSQSRVAQYHLNANASHRHQLNQLLIDEFSDLKEPTENHALLARLPIQTYWTTNYDRLIENALEAGGRRVDTKYTNEQLARACTHKSGT